MTHVLATKSFNVEAEIENKSIISNKYEPAPLTPDFASMIMLVSLISFA
jgi:hypothetical protein